MWKKLHFLLSTPGVTSLTQYRTARALCWLWPKPQQPGPHGGGGPRSLTHTFRKCVSTHPQVAAFPGITQVSRMVFMFVFNFEPMMQGRDWSEINLKYFFSKYLKSDGLSTSASSIL